MTDSKRSTAKRKPIVALRGKGWRIEYNRDSMDYSAIINGIGCIGNADSSNDAETLINDYNYRKIAPAMEAFERAMVAV